MPGQRTVSSLRMRSVTAGVGRDRTPLVDGRDDDAGVPPFLRRQRQSPGYAILTTDRCRRETEPQGFVQAWVQVVEAKLGRIVQRAGPAHGRALLPPRRPAAGVEQRLRGIRPGAGLVQVGEVGVQVERQLARDRERRVVARVKVDVKAATGRDGNLHDEGAIVLGGVTGDARVVIVRCEQVGACGGDLHEVRRLLVDGQAEARKETRVGIVEAADPVPIHFAVRGQHEERLVAIDVMLTVAGAQIASVDHDRLTRGRGARR